MQIGVQTVTRGQSRDSTKIWENCGVTTNLEINISDNFTSHMTFNEKRAMNRIPTWRQQSFKKRLVANEMCTEIWSEIYDKGNTGMQPLIDGASSWNKCNGKENIFFTFFEPYIVIYLCNKNEQNAHFFLDECFNLIIVSSACFEHSNIPSSGRFVRAVLWYFFHTSVQAVWVDGRMSSWVFLRMNTWMFETCRRHYN